ncbi:MAG TPA: LamG-like jellyroll fold domain-containing protein, partial [Bacteroidia bacterium]
GWNNDFSGQTQFNANTYYHVVVSFNGTTTTVYINGVSDGSTGKTYNTILSGAGLLIGNAPANDGWHSYFNGAIDDIRIYNRALAQSEVQQLYATCIAPNVSISASSTVICAGSNVTLTASGANTYSWSTGATTQSITVAPAANTTYSVTGTNIGLCSASASQAITVNPLPSNQITASGSLIISQGGSVTFDAGSFASYLWSTGATTEKVTITTAGSYSVTVTNSYGCSNSFHMLHSLQPTGGIITSVGANRIHTFLSSGTFTAPANFNTTAKVLVVGGGGGGSCGGGGGAGGFIETTLPVSVGTFAVVAGAGGLGAGYPNATNGGNSIFSSLVAIGGGAGGGCNYRSFPGIDGGSGGGAGMNQNAGEYQPGGNGTFGQGNAGGNNTGQSCSPCGGGGGAGGPGGSGAAGGMQGGPGLSSSISGTVQYYAGGGGGGSWCAGSAAGGIGGGGNGGQGSSGMVGTAGTPNTGGGGGGSSTSGNGGSGIVIISYPVTAIDSSLTVSINSIKYTPAQLSATLSGTDSIIKTIVVQNTGYTSVNYNCHPFATYPISPSCRPSTTGTCCGMGIYNVTFNTINNTTAGATDGYKDYSSSQSTVVTAGKSYSFYVRTGTSYNEHVCAWVDFNNNGIFETSEKVYESLNVNINHTGTISIPKNTPVGKALRMRVASEYASNAPPQACNNVQYGQFEDYSVIVSNGISIPTTGDTLVPMGTDIISVKFNSAGLNKGKYFSNVIMTSSDPLHNYDTIPSTLYVDGNPLMSLSKSAVNFDSTMEFTTRKDSLWIRNKGIDTLKISGIISSSADITFSCSKMNILPSDSAKLNLVFNPKTVKTYNETVQINTNDVNTNVSVTGICFSPPVIAKNKNSISVTLSCFDSITVQLAIRNAGQYNLVEHINPQVPLNGLVDYFPFSGNVTDESYHGNNGTVYGTSLTSDRAGYSGKAYSFNGSSYITHSTSGMNPQMGTVCGWVKPTQTNSWGFWQTHDENNVNWNDWISIFTYTDGNFFFRMGNGSSCCSNDVVFNSGTFMPANQWSFLSCTWEGTTMRVYVNGVKVAERTNATFQTNIDPVARIGWGHQQGMRGSMDNICVYNRALTLQEIKNIYSQNTIYQNGISYSTSKQTIHPGDSAVVPIKFYSAGLLKGVYHSNLIISSNDPQKSLDTVNVTFTQNGNSLLKLSRYVVNYDSVIEYASRKDSIYIANKGCDSLIINSITSSTSDVTFNNSSYRLFPGDSVKFIMTFNPKRAGNYNDSVTIAGNANTKVIQIKGVSVTPPFNSYHPTSLSVTLGCNDTTSRLITIKNTGVANLIENLNPPAPANGLVAYYPFSGNANDASGNSNNCTIGGAALSKDRMGNMNSSYIFNGSNNSISTNTLPAFSRFTLSYWVKNNGADGGYDRISSINGSTFETAKDGSGTLKLYCPACGWNNVGYTLGLNQWTYISWVSNGTSIKIYANGAIVSTFNYSFSIGSTAWNFGGFGSECANVSLDEIRIYDRDLSASEIQQLYKCQDNLVSYSASSKTVHYGDSATHRITFNSAGLIRGVYNGNVVINTNNPQHLQDTIPYTVTLNGFPAISLSKNSLQFDSTMRFTSRKDSLWIRNEGCDTLKINSTIPSSADLACSCSNANIAPGDSARLLITFSPATVKSYNETIQVNNNDVLKTIAVSGPCYAQPTIAINPNTLSPTLSCCDSVS